MKNHKVEWVKDLDRMNKLETVLTNEIGFLCMTIDRQVGTDRLSTILSDYNEDSQTFFLVNEDNIDRRKAYTDDLAVKLSRIS